MFQLLDENNPYKEWLNAANLLDPPYDYFNFADVHKRDVDVTNGLYLSVLNHHLTKSTKKAQAAILIAIRTFNGRRNKITRFSSQYASYWSSRNEEEAAKLFQENQTNQQKRTYEALQEISENVIDNMVSTSRQLNNIQEKRRKSVESASILHEEMTGLKSLDLDDPGASLVMEENVLAELKERTVLKPYDLSAAATSLLDSITNKTKSIMALRKILKNCGTIEEEYDPVTNADVDFIETTGLYFINLALSPRNPLNFITLERTAAVHTSIFFLNALFLSVNDKIVFSWIEIETLLTQKTKWDGVGFCPTLDKKIGLVLVEFAGGILWNKTKKKAAADMKKIEKGVLDFIEYTESEVGHFVRYHDLQLYFEIILFVDGTYVRRNCATIKFPATPVEFTAFFLQLPNVIQWRQSLVNSVSDIST